MRTLVLAYCMVDLRTFDFGFFHKIYIYSRCDQVPNYKGEVIVVNSTQTGSCDFEYARHIATYGIDGPTLFMKDSFQNVHQRARLRPITSVIFEGTSGGFACALFWEKYNSSILWHDTSIKKFALKRYKSEDIHSNFSNLGAWWDAHPKLFSNDKFFRYMPV